MVTNGGIAIKDPQIKNIPNHLGLATTPENNYLNIALQLGIIGLILFLLYLYFLLQLTYHIPKSFKHLALGILFITLIAAIDFPAFAVNMSAITFSGLLGTLLLFGETT